MNDWIKKMAPWGGLLPAAAVIICAQITLSGYTAPVFEVQEPPTELETEIESAKEKESESSVQETESETEEKAAETKEGTYKDGTYYGTANGYRGNIKVAVTVKDGKITDITVQEVSDDAAFFSKAKALLTQMVEKQTTEVDTVSGATYSSAGLINAVRNALKEAGADVPAAQISLPAAPKADQPSAGASKTVEKAKDPSKFKNGTYYGTGTGFSGTIKVKVVIKKGKIKTITVVDSSDDAAYLNKAKALLDKIIKKQGTDVDTVSGATYSSTGLINAVRDALEDAAQTEKTPETEAPVTPATPGTVPYKDGVYYGTGEGYRGDITVAVTISNKTIQDIQITAAEDDQAFLSKAKAILNQVLSKQNTSVDVVSGATFSSKGILEAINNALLEAKKATEGSTAPETDATEKETEKITEKESETATESESETQTQIYADGTYAVEAVCEPSRGGDFVAYTLSASVTITEGKVTAVTDIQGLGDSYDLGNDWYISRAANGTKKYPGVVTQITEKGTADGIDAVSGATCSSNAIITAVKKAFEMAKAGGNK